jgi:hypothetical protein
MILLAKTSKSGRSKPLAFCIKKLVFVAKKGWLCTQVFYEKESHGVFSFFSFE